MACRHNWLNNSLSSNSSPIWRSLMGTKHLISKAASLVVGNGNSIRIWEDLWVPDLPNFTPIPKAVFLTKPPFLKLELIQRISYWSLNFWVLSHSHPSWDMHKLRFLFDEETIISILRIPISPASTVDCWSWTLTSSREISVLGVPSPVSKGKIWKSNLHDRHELFLWRTAASCLLTKNNLSRCFDCGEMLCPLHLFALCPVAKAIWFMSKGV